MERRDTLKRDPGGPNDRAGKGARSRGVRAAPKNNSKGLMVAAFSEPGTPGKDQTISVGHVEAGVHFLSPPPAVLVDTANTPSIYQGLASSEQYSH